MIEGRTRYRNQKANVSLAEWLAVHSCTFLRLMDQKDEKEDRQFLAYDDSTARNRRRTPLRRQEHNRSSDNTRISMQKALFPPVRLVEGPAETRCSIGPMGVNAPNPRLVSHPQLQFERHLSATATIYSKSLPPLVRLVVVPNECTAHRQKPRPALGGNTVQPINASPALARHRVQTPACV